MICEHCFVEGDGRSFRTRDGVRVCRECADWEDYWEGLSDEQKALEYAAMEAYEAEFNR